MLVTQHSTFRLREKQEERGSAHPLAAKDIRQKYV